MHSQQGIAVPGSSQSMTRERAHVHVNGASLPLTVCVLLQWGLTEPPHKTREALLTGPQGSNFAAKQRRKALIVTRKVLQVNVTPF